MTLSPAFWLTLIVSLPSASGTTRMRIWRAVKALGCAALRDGAYLLPAQAEQAAQLQTLAPFADTDAEIVSGSCLLIGSAGYFAGFDAIRTTASTTAANGTERIAIF